MIEEIKKDNIIVPKEKYEELVKSSDFLEKSFEEFSGAPDEEKESFYHLCNVGIVAERFLHEFDRVISLCDKQLNNLETKYGAKETEEMRYSLNVLKNELGLIGALKYVADEEKKQKTTAQDCVEYIIKLYKEDLDAAKIVYKQEGSNFDISIAGSSFRQVIDNIINNAIYWLKLKTLMNDREIRIKYIREQRKIEISNNGPSISQEILKKLFKQTFVTSKQGGRGLGMFISNKIIELGGGKIEASNKDNWVSFVVTVGPDQK